MKKGNRDSALSSCRELRLLVGTCSVTVASDASVCVASFTALARGLAFEHLAVLGDAVALTLGDGVLLAVGGALGGSPGEVVTADLNVVIGEFAELVVIHTEELGLFRCAEVKSRNHVDAVREEGAHNEGVDGGGYDVGNLLVHLLPLVLDPASNKDSVVHTVKANDVVGSEDAVEDKADDSSDAVLSEHVHSIINLDPELDCTVVSY